MREIEDKLKDYLNSTPEPIQQVLILAQAAHPIWEDYLEIMQLANKQILQPVGAFPDEHVLASIGVHSKTAFTGKRDSIGFLVTNLRVLTQTDVSLLGAAEKAQVYLFTQTQKSEDATSKIWNDFLIKNKLTVPQELLAAMQNALKDVINIVLPRLQALNHLPQEIKKSTNIFDRIKDMGLQDVLKSYAQEEKYLKKFSEKYNVPDIIAGSVDKPFFSSVYGFVITPTGIASRDVMEECLFSTWEEIRQHPATPGSKGDEILAGQKTHIIPPFNKQYAPFIITLINELASGEVSVK